ncbi:MAG: ATP-binding protein [Thermoproteota archaeon]|jgi:Predicted ATPase (AAA+ superfamily)
MKREDLIAVLADWNFWGKGLESGISRKIYTKKIYEILFSETNKIISIFGVRRGGKSFILREVSKYLVEKFGAKNVLYINFEEVRLEKTLETLLDAYYAYLEIIRPTMKPFLLLDEIQEIIGWEKFVRSLNEKNEAKIIVAGSSAKLMSEEFATLLAGRDIAIEVFPLNFFEFLEFKGFPIYSYEEAVIYKTEVLRRLREYLEFGGFPEVVLEKNENIKKEILKRYYETILIKDVKSRFKLRESGYIEKLTNFYLTNISSQISFNKLSKILNIPVKTVERFSKFVSTSRMLFFIEKFSFGARERLASPLKVYSIDTGISNVIGFRFMENFGKCLENLVAVELQRKFGKPTYEISYWKDYQQHEVDFVIKQGLNIKQLIQVTYASSKDEIEKREIRSLIKASELLKCKDLFIITWDFEDNIKYDDKVIKILPLWKWLFTLNTL